MSDPNTCSLTNPVTQETVDAELARTAKEIMAVGSKSFTWAATMFSEELRISARMLYTWCRYCDDQVDTAVGEEAKAARVRALREQTKAALEGKPQSDTVFRAFQLVAQKHKIPTIYALDLIQGMEMDVVDRDYADFTELELYCYHVAGVVGLMMVYIMGVSDPRALKNAVDLGIAMQLTNISRDVVDDSKLGRCYLPQDWLAIEGLSKENYADRENRDKVVNVVAKLLDHTEFYYASGRAGLRFLPFRAAIAIAVAANVYGSIGHLVRARGIEAWDTRSVVSKPRKALATLKGIWQVLLTIPYRIVSPWRKHSFKDVWRPSWVE